ncbi:MAG: hypothetical protein JO015_19695 [Verrucomicrobia bacterium]|nr:hypothetical protein [Verrucomicrobiota bacterium]
MYESQYAVKTSPESGVPKERGTGVRSGWVLAVVAAAASALVPGVLANDQVPAGFSASRYARLWERNPFTLVTPAAPQATPSVFEKLALVSWFRAGKDTVVFVQNTETNEVQKITTTPNAQGLRLVEIHPSSNPQGAEVVLADNAQQGTIRFRMDAQPAVGTPGVQGAPPGVAGQPVQPGAPGQPGVPVQPGQGRNFPPYNAGAVANQTLNTMPPGQGAGNPGAYPRGPTVNDYRRRRVLPTPNYSAPSPPQVNPNGVRAQ